MVLPSTYPISSFYLLLHSAGFIGFNSWEFFLFYVLVMMVELLGFLFFLFFSSCKPSSSLKHYVLFMIYLVCSKRALLENLIYCFLEAIILSWSHSSQAFFPIISVKIYLSRSQWLPDCWIQWSVHISFCLLAAHLNDKLKFFQHNLLNHLALNYLIFWDASFVLEWIQRWLSRSSIVAHPGG